MFNYFGYIVYLLEIFTESGNWYITVPQVCHQMCFYMTILYNILMYHGLLIRCADT